MWSDVCANIMIKCHAALANIFENTLPCKQRLKILTWSFNRQMRCPFHLSRAGTSCCGRNIKFRPCIQQRLQEIKNKGQELRRSRLPKRYPPNFPYQIQQRSPKTSAAKARVRGARRRGGDGGAGRGAAAGGGARGVVGLERRRQWQSFNRLFVYKSIRNTFLKEQKKTDFKGPENPTCVV